MTTNEGQFKGVEARRDERGEVRVWLEFDDCRIALTPDEAHALLVKLDCACFRASRLHQPQAVHITATKGAEVAA